MKKLGIITALPAEAKCFHTTKINLKSPFEIEKGIFLCISGIGYKSSLNAAKELIKLIKPDILVKGGDYNKTEIVGYKTVIQYGGKVETVALLEGYSTSDLINNFNP